MSSSINNKQQQNGSGLHEPLLLQQANGSDSNRTVMNGNHVIAMKDDASGPRQRHEGTIIPIQLETTNLNYYIGVKESHLLKDVSLKFSPGFLTAVMG